MNEPYGFIIHRDRLNPSLLNHNPQKKKKEIREKYIRDSENRLQLM